MDNGLTITNTGEAPAEKAPREVVLRYIPPDPREVSLRYDPPDPREVVECYVSPPEPEERIWLRIEDRLDALTRQSLAAAEREAPDGEEQPTPPRKGRSIFAVCLSLLLIASLTLGILYWKGVIPRRADYNTENRFETDRRADYDASSDEVATTIERYPNGDGTRLYYDGSHGEALTIQEIYERVNPCTVTVATALPNGGAIIGTGVIFTPDGYILTNAHVIVGGTQCYVVLDTGRSFSDVKLVGYDAEKDLAVIKIDAHLLPTAAFGDSDALTVGDPVYAIGNPLGVELRGTLTDGIVSAINRDVSVDGVRMTLIQTNAALNNGNSGGPLINIYGQVVGINTMKMGSSSAVSIEGLGFAIPISSAAWMVNDLIAYGEIHSEPILGITVLRQPIALGSGETALEVYEMLPGGPGEKAGLMLGDLILSADGEPVESLNDLLRIRRRFGAGETLTLGIDRAGERLNIDVTLEEATE